MSFAQMGIVVSGGGESKSSSQKGSKTPDVYQCAHPKVGLEPTAVSLNYT